MKVILIGPQFSPITGTHAPKLLELNLNLNLHFGATYYIPNLLKLELNLNLLLHFDVIYHAPILLELNLNLKLQMYLQCTKFT